ncbi:hypothetical protein NC797_05675 [Aquibacillus sp. 3ASR75-11]|uniref:Uncharacterized protein n=1 Tax=Terrihalobacillus insolitus TaxID=2950438 RepID=A0A9X3WTK4_9BACI|nr:hypothetical protein [Terrihalobacillus insolitus]MDC3412646.1 hypothetical protein [Terrihalobacillus insolitus]MDC3423996.1 hypothetical protein [Terrihalobacillus insolitus]
MKQYALLRILLAGFFLYVAWPSINGQMTQLSSIFWAGWLVFLLLVVGANFATLLKMTKPPVMEQEKKQPVQVGNN